MNLRAWILLGPHLHERFDVGLRDYVLLMALPLLVAALVRLPVGVLTDRYGARVMFPVVSLASAVSVLGLGLAESLPAVVVFGSTAGLAGAALVVGGSLVSRTVPYGRRGLALGVFGLGATVAVVISALSWRLGPDGRRAALLLGVALVVFAGLAALVFRDPVTAHRARSPLGTCVEMIKLASTTSLSVLYALALGGVVASAVYLPVYLATVFRMEWFHALAVTGTLVGLGAGARLLGGWWTDRRPTPQLLTVCYTVAAGLCLVAASDPQLRWLSILVIGAIAVCDGVASGVLLALIGKAARAESVGAVMGATGAVAALGALVPPLLIAGADRLSQSHAVAWILLAALLLVVALYVRAHGLRIGLGLAVRFEPEPGPTAMTVAVVGEAETQLGAAAVVARLAELAASDELVVVYGSDRPVRRRPSANVLVLGLRDRLPRHSVVGVGVTPYAGTLGALAAPVGESVEAGEVAIAVTPTADLSGVAAELSSYLRADRVLRVSYSPAGGAGLHEVWNRRTAATNHG
ncbi:NNP family nitrate/nitrite transporter-like MFS transporter [Plantactinospora soyae]|uniref:NNP family nitrate/nitrite transporter-like MFS transporter n=1 Tax=Plantactinospora soyae TaxID=1544732 RepID=A0A927QUB9_9ACTN|nr:MFS transporter [Plantactinospora soyae]MBE1484380.1 NNP family nitrate/nitrite transporter-like MFS transporter [Plantactinospora soyae]